VGVDPELLLAEVDRVLRGAGKRGRVPALWDGNAAERTADVYVAALTGRSPR
jgi:UDP-N-acetylglucosamine 2-epimerase (non-hydrolysing)